MAKDLFGELNPDQIKAEIWQTRFPPVETTRIIVTESAIESTGSGVGLTQDEMEQYGSQFRPQRLRSEGI